MSRFVNLKQNINNLKQNVIDFKIQLVRKKRTDVLGL